MFTATVTTDPTGATRGLFLEVRVGTDTTLIGLDANVMTFAVRYFGEGVRGVVETAIRTAAQRHFMDLYFVNAALLAECLPNIDAIAA